ncbi:dCMP deaminase (plasmid) [Rhizobium ruizarguesonis]|uniref:anti-phage dCTP deaminase n=1 Tax=Rhizobium ruizarguesonis TaxID=2081791 RepID=UPI00163AE917|nr:anti-phage dCTP deaminase [Rhizobium ruizarguesonis]MBC2808060.1 dCMP deaminase [Rhizobium ruizarguesonis]
MATQTFQNSDKNPPEIVIGIVSPVGTVVRTSIEALRKEFGAKGYNVHHIKISDQFPAIAETFGYAGLNTKTRYDRIDSYITFGNYLRDNMGAATLAAVAISAIAEKRPPDRGRGNAFIIDQLKTEQELDLLRDVYGTSFFQISIYSARDVRVDNLANGMAHDNKKRDANFFRGKSETLVARDEDEFNEPNGQKVGKIFQFADVVINADRTEDHNNVADQIERFIDLLFGHNGYSPNRLEYGMYLAHSAALRSLDLSRQVGAAIFRKSGEIAALGANEVPKAGGGTYWADDHFDAREYKLGSDSNDKRKLELLEEVLEIAVGGVDKLSTDQKKQLDKSQFMDALEYGRIVHAEMSALSDAARLGISVQDATIYCTTFPCHMCAKHIVASGLARVVFLEPYPKSLTSDLHSDAVKIEGMSRSAYGRFPSVEFAPFFGITPRRYREFFSRNKRKSGADFESYRKGTPHPMIKNDIAKYLELETAAIGVLASSIQGLLSKLPTSGVGVN